MAATTSRENEVAQILLDLRALIFKFDRHRGFPFTWGTKRKRSAINVSPSPSPSPLPPPPPPFKGEVSSPATPLSFSPSESDDNNNNNNPALLRRNVSLKRKREHYMKTVEEITKDNELLQGEIENVKSYLHRLKDFNLKLKAKKHEISLQSSGTAEPPQIGDGARGQATASLGGAASTSGDVGRNGIIPDLNMPFEEEEDEERVAAGEEESVEASDDAAAAARNLSRTVAAAQARHNRIQIQRVKNPIGSNKNRYSFR